MGSVELRGRGGDLVRRGCRRVPSGFGRAVVRCWLDAVGQSSRAPPSESAPPAAAANAAAPHQGGAFWQR
eukprot:9938193-Lingulodinium_polyedra.AAC.1